jgi:uncharacterized membrane protein
MNMQFAMSYSWWVLLLLAAGAGAVAGASYAGAIVPLSRGRRAVLSTCRALTLLLVIACLLRPVRVIPPGAGTNAIVPVLVDASRSMGLADMNGRTRADVAGELVSTHVRPVLQDRFRAEFWTFGNSLQELASGSVPANGARSDLSGALRALRDRYRERRIAGVVVISDGGDTGTQDAAAVVDDGAVPVYAIGVGATDVPSDFEVLDVSAGDMALTESSVDITVAALHRGDSAPFDLRLLENGRPIDIRRMTPAADGSPVRAVFTVSPPRDEAAVYTAEIPSAAGEPVLENNRRSVLVEPPGRRRQILMVEGAPGFEHSFIKRALDADAGLELDSAVRKGRDARGAATYFVQAAEARAPLLATGFPQERKTLYQYDAVILANVEADALSRQQLQLLADFVDQRGGGLLVLGAKSFANQGFVSTPIEDVLPLRLSDRSGGVLRASARAETQLAVSVTSDGEAHPVMRIGATPEDTAKRWTAVPPLSGAATLGTLRPGAQVLATVHAPDGLRPLVAVQRYGQGRSMVFAGEASWRWRMQMPSDDRTYELFWRQAVRWLATGAPDRIAIAHSSAPVPGTAGAVSVDVRSEDFSPVGDAQVTIRVIAPGGRTQEAHAALADPRTGRYGSEFRFDEPGMYRIVATAVRGGERLGATERRILVGGADLEMSDPRLNEEVLRRIATASGGGYLRANDAGRLASLLAAAQADPAAPVLEDLWHNIWIFAAVMTLLAAEWTLRRRWGLR